MACGEGSRSGCLDVENSGMPAESATHLNVIYSQNYFEIIKDYLKNPSKLSIKDALYDI